jgi:hypothetical protein
MNNEKFIMEWEKNRQKGKIKYVVTGCIIPALAGVVGSFIGIFIKEGNFFHSLAEYYVCIYMSVFLGLFGGIGSLLKWSRNEEKYNKLVKKNSNNRDF